MQNRPDAVELLAAVRELLREVSQSIHDDGLRFRVLIAANVLSVVERELTTGDHSLIAELEQLHTLLPDVTLDPDLALRDEIAKLNRILAERVRQSPSDSPLVKVGAPAWEFAKQTLRDQLAVSNPSFDTEI